MKKSIAAQGITLVLCLLIGMYIGTKLGDNEPRSQPTGLSDTKQIKVVPPNGTKPQLIVENPALFLVNPTISSDCDKFSATEKENCLFSIAIRQAKNGSDIGVCKNLQDSKRCEKTIADQFSQKFNILPK